MSEHDTIQHRRLFELMADEAVQPLSPEEQAELRRLAADFDDVDSHSFELAAAALDLGFDTDDEPMPAALRDQVEVDAIDWLARRRGLSLAGADAMPAGGARSAWLPWLVAAACLVLTLVVWRVLGGAADASPLAEQYAALVDEPGSVRATWDDPGELGVDGDIVWNNSKQTGIMRFAGLATNDRERIQYQLWIFDAAREAFTEFNAVDGGVFDIESDGEETYVRVDAKLEVFEPSIFAVTTEPPGGVVKHVDTDEHRIVLVAPVSR